MIHRLRAVRPILSGIVALVSCPCHLPLTLPVLLSLTAGTVLGMWLASNTAVVVGGSVILFAGSLMLTLRWSKTASEACLIEPDPKPCTYNHENQDSAWT